MYDTCYPTMNYFPAYPGSEWFYLTNKGDTVRAFIYDQMSTNVFTVQSQATIYHRTGPKYACGFFSFGTGCGWVCSYNCAHKFMSEDEDEWRYAFGYKGYRIYNVDYRDFSVTLDSTTYDSVTVVSSGCYINYYAKNVGLIMEICDFVNSDTLAKLISYNINN